jgi:opacity protein-like surface antigen
VNVRYSFVLCAILSSVQAWPQAHPTSGEIPSAEQPKAEIFGGFSLAAGGVAGTGYGFNGGVDFRIAHRIYAVADVSQVTDPKPSGVNTMSDTAYLIGPRYLFAVRPRASIFGQFLVGGDAFHNSGQSYTFSYNTATTFALEAGGGLDYALNRHVSTRLEAGYLHGSLKYSTYGGPANPGSVANNRGRFVVDLVYRF